MPTPRRFLLSDAIVLVAATALGLFVVRPYSSRYADRSVAPVCRRTWIVGWASCTWNCLAARGSDRHGVDARGSPSQALPRSAALAPAASAAGIRGRHDGRGCSGHASGWLRHDVARVVGQPKLFILHVRRTGGGGAQMGLPPGGFYFELDHILGTMAIIGVSVAASWIFLLASGAWRSERGWVDRTGRVLGYFWIATLPLTGWWDFHVRF